MILALVDDLFFSTRIAGVAAQFGIPLKVVTSRQDLLDVLPQGPDKIILDLNCGSCDPVEIIREVRSLYPAVSLVAFASHVQSERIEVARQAGCNQVVARSYFTAHLPEILKGSVDSG